MRGPRRSGALSESQETAPSHPARAWPRFSMQFRVNVLSRPHPIRQLKTCQTRRAALPHNVPPTTHCPPLSLAARSSRNSVASHTALSSPNAPPPPSRSPRLPPLVQTVHWPATYHRVNGQMAADDVRRRVELTEAAEQDADPQTAQFLLACVHAIGLGGPEDIAEAMRLLLLTDLVEADDAPIFRALLSNVEPSSKAEVDSREQLEADDYDALTFQSLSSVDPARCSPRARPASPLPCIL